MDLLHVFLAALAGYFAGGWLMYLFIIDTQQIFYVAEVKDHVEGIPKSFWIVGPPLLPECEWTRRYVNVRNRWFQQYPDCVTHRWNRSMQKAGSDNSVYRKWIYTFKSMDA